jgi:hypothetical protein
MIGRGMERPLLHFPERPFMPIHCPIKIKRQSPAEFEKIDYRVMGHAYSSQNDLGRLCDECVYHADLKARLIADGFRSVLTAVPITVSHCDFRKKYFLDLVVDDALYELKTDASFCRAIQWINLNHARIEFTTITRKAIERVKGIATVGSNSPAVHSPALNRLPDHA